MIAPDNGEASRDVKLCIMTPAPIDWARVQAVWRASGCAAGTITVYARSARRFVDHCVAHGRSPIACLRRRAAEQFVAREVRSQVPESGRAVVTAVRAFSCALAALGFEVPVWSAAAQKTDASKLVRDFIEYRLRHRGIAVSTSKIDARHVTSFLEFLRRRRRKISRVRLVDVDAFIQACAAKWVPRSVAGACASLRAFLRFLHLSGRLRFDLASAVASPRIRFAARPPRVLQWRDVRRILRAVEVSEPLGRRDFALFLMMATYGMGSAEVRALQLDDIDWTARTIRLRRPKTDSVTILPLLAPVARALVRYLRDERPAHARDRAVFVSRNLPHRRLAATATVRHRLDKLAKRAGFHAPFLGTHVFRHTHATHQVDAGTPAKLVGDILGHRQPSSTSAYVRSAIVGLRALALPVPR